jgi:hypothetical protein
MHFRPRVVSTAPRKLNPTIERAYLRGVLGRIVERPINRIADLHPGTLPKARGIRTVAPNKPPSLQGLFNAAFRR